MTVPSIKPTQFDNASVSSRIEYVQSVNDPSSLEIILWSPRRFRKCGMHAFQNSFSMSLHLQGVAIRRKNYAFIKQRIGMVAITGGFSICNSPTNCTYHL